MKLLEIQNVMDIKEDQQVCCISFFDNKTELRASVNEVLAEELQKPVIKKFKGRNVYAMVKDNTQAADLVKMGLSSFSNHGVKHLLRVIDSFTNNLGLRF